MAMLRGRWKTGQKIMDNLDLLEYKLKATKSISPTCNLYIFSIDFAGQTGEMHIFVEFDKILDKSYLNCGFERDLTVSTDRTLLFLAEYLLKNSINK